MTDEHCPEIIRRRVRYILTRKGFTSAECDLHSNVVWHCLGGNPFIRTMVGASTGLTRYLTRRMIDTAVNASVESICPTRIVPPVNAVFLIYLFVSEDKRKRFISHFDEEFSEATERLGEKRAELWYWVEVFRAISPVLGKRVYKLIEKLVGVVWAVAFRRSSGP